MGLSVSLLSPGWKDIVCRYFGLTGHVDERVIIRSISFNEKDREMILRTVSFEKNNSDTSKSSDGSTNMKIEESLKYKSWRPEKSKLKASVSFKKLVLDTFLLKSKNDESIATPKPSTEHPLPSPAILYSPRPVSELDAAAVKVQKVYKSYRTRRNLADCAVVVEELWWKALDFAALKQSSVCFFDVNKPQTAASRWARARTRAAKVGKGLSKDEKAQKLALQHWLEAIDPRHRYGHNLHFYYDIWFDSESTQPFFYWLDVGDGKEVNLERCPKVDLQRQCIKYLGPNERENYEVIIDSGKLVYKRSGMFVNTSEGFKWIFVLSTSRSLYVGQKKKGVFQHSSFLSGAAATSAGRLVVREGILEAIWPYSGHYHPTEENFKEFLSFLEEHHVDLTDVKRCAIDEDSPSTSFKTTDEEIKADIVEDVRSTSSTNLDATTTRATVPSQQTTTDDMHINEDVPAIDLGRRLSCKWSTGAGPRIGCVRDYAPELQIQALEHVNLSPRVTITPGAYRNNGPIRSPRPSPKVRLSPRLSSMVVPSPRLCPPISK